MVCAKSLRKKKLEKRVAQKRMFFSLPANLTFLIFLVASFQNPYNITDNLQKQKKKILTKKFCHRKISPKNPKTEFSLQKASKKSSTKPFKKKCTYRTIAKSKSIQDLQQKTFKKNSYYISHNLQK